MLGLQKPLQSSFRRNNSFMNDFLKCVLHRMNKKRKIITNFLKQFKKSKAKKKYYSETLLKCTRDIKKHGVL